MENTHPIRVTGPFDSSPSHASRVGRVASLFGAVCLIAVSVGCVQVSEDDEGPQIGARLEATSLTVFEDCDPSSSGGDGEFYFSIALSEVMPDRSERLVGAIDDVRVPMKQNSTEIFDDVWIEGFFPADEFIYLIADIEFYESDGATNSGYNTTTAEAVWNPEERCWALIESLSCTTTGFLFDMGTLRIGEGDATCDGRLSWQLSDNVRGDG